jgi:hypothetical protein
MCGRVGIIWSKKLQRAEERKHVKRLFTRQLVLSKSWSPRARECAWLTGTPLLQVPNEDILIHSTAAFLTNAATQARLSEQAASIPRETPQQATGLRVRGTSPAPARH